MKKNLKGKRFDDVEAVKTALLRALDDIKVEEFQRCFKHWGKRFHKCIAFNGDRFIILIIFVYIVYLDGGLEELIDELNSGKVMYAFCKVIDQNTSLPKFVLINWQGEGAPLSRKGSCANHVVDVVNFFKGAHVTINARTEDDVEPSLIMEKVAKSTASKFNFKERSDPVENITPVGSVYKRIQPTREIDPIEREKFWMKEQLKEAHARDEVIKERSRSICKMREAERNAENSARNAWVEKKQWEKQQEDDAKEEKERMSRSESLRRERNQEAQALISKRTINARAIFEQNTCAGQMSAISAGRRATYPAIQLNSFQMMAKQMALIPPELLAAYQRSKIRIGNNIEDLLKNSDLLGDKNSSCIPVRVSVTSYKTCMDIPIVIIKHMVKLKEAHARDEVIKERSRSICKMREAERNAENSARNAWVEKKQWEKQQEDDAKEEKERMSRSESLRRERNQEAQALISKRTINARAIFEQNTCAGQMSAISAGRRATYPAIQPTLTEEVTRSSSMSSPTEPQTFYSLQETDIVEQESLERENQEKTLTSQIPPEHFNYTRNLLKEGLPPRQDSELDNNLEEEQNWDEPTLEAPPDVRDPLTEMMAEHGINVSQQQQVKDPPQVIMANNEERTWVDLRARALYDYQAADETEISFDPDDIISQIEQIDEGWWQGMAPDGSYGLFPANYVELLD
ncbi:drebrin-like protein [Centruroides sculpturatus]|uniref:drebrin-like protein n=2 Tax=Centruroides sculpturatus TaxID=218467 RepID=UPI000C6E4656|nr:drebrin-like protein [Centruroides sculpturatus]